MCNHKSGRQTERAVMRRGQSTPNNRVDETRNQVQGRIIHAQDRGTGKSVPVTTYLLDQLRLGVPINKTRSPACFREPARAIKSLVVLEDG
jgi:hypothetical protein